jgi:aspartyl-tRNA synthetase
LDAELAFIDGAEDIRVILEEVVADTIAVARQKLESTQNPLAEKLPEVPRPFPRITFARCEEWLGRPGAEADLGAEDEKTIGEKVAAEYHRPFYFITDFPTGVKKQTFYAQRQDANPALTGYFDLGFRGLELASGGPREHRYEQLVQNLRTAGLSPEAFAGYLEAFRFGMPAHGGFGFGVDRFVWALAQVSNIREARLFPRDRYRLEP